MDISSIDNLGRYQSESTSRHTSLSPKPEKLSCYQYISLLLCPCIQFSYGNYSYTHEAHDCYYLSCQQSLKCNIIPRELQMSSTLLLLSTSQKGIESRENTDEQQIKQQQLLLKFHYFYNAWLIFRATNILIVFSFLMWTSIRYIAVGRAGEDMIYLTQWINIITLIYMIFAFISTVIYQKNVQPQPLQVFDQQLYVNALYTIQQILLHVSVPGIIIMSVVYWSLMFNIAYIDSFAELMVNIGLHAISAILLLTDFLLRFVFCFFIGLLLLLVFFVMVKLATNVLQIWSILLLFLIIVYFMEFGIFIFWFNSR